MTLIQRLDKLLDELVHAEDMSLQAALRPVLAELRRKIADRNLDNGSPPAEVVVVIVQGRAGPEDNHHEAGR
jgi:hypothetical protein